MKIPESVLSEFAESIDNLNGFGSASLTVTQHDHNPRFTLITEKKIIPGKSSSGAQGVEQ